MGIENTLKVGMETDIKKVRMWFHEYTIQWVIFHQSTDVHTVIFRLCVSRKSKRKWNGIYRSNAKDFM